MIDNPEELAKELGVAVELVERWARDLEIIVADCLDKIADPDKKQLALYYLVAFMIQSSQKDLVSESVDDASRSFAAVQKDMRQNPYGSMALMIAPCLASVGGVKQYTAWLLR